MSCLLLDTKTLVAHALAAGNDSLAPKRCAISPTAMPP